MSDGFPGIQWNLREVYRASTLGDVTGKRKRTPADGRNVGKRCLAYKDDMSVCGAVLSCYNQNDKPICNPCARRFALRDEPPRLAGAG